MRPLHWPTLIGGATFICVLLLLLRFLWVYLADWVVRLVRGRWLGHPLDPPDHSKTFVVGWAGMRGVLTLAAALSLPVTTDAGTPFPHRAGILFLAFAAILVSLTGQGLSLPWIIAKLKVCASVRLLEEERWARRRLINAALQMLEYLREKAGDDGEVATELIERYYRQRLEMLQETDENRPSVEKQQEEFASTSRLLRRVEREELLRLEHEGKIGGDTHRKLERELDLLDMRYTAY